MKAGGLCRETKTRSYLAPGIDDKVSPRVDENRFPPKVNLGLRRTNALQTGNGAIAGLQYATDAIREERCNEF